MQTFLTEDEAYRYCSEHGVDTSSIEHVGVVYIVDDTVKVKSKSKPKDDETTGGFDKASP